MNELEQNARNLPDKEYGGYQGCGDLTFWKMIAESFRGKQGWMAVLACIYVFVFTAAWIYSLVKLLTMDPDASVKTMLVYLTIFLVTMIATVATKLSYWMLMNRNSVLRAIRRVDGRLAELLARTGAKE